MSAGLFLFYFFRGPPHSLIQFCRHQHIFPYQVISFPKMDTHNDYFQDGDYHDVLLVPIGGDEAEDYGKAVIRTHLDSITGQMLGHCHFYRHTE